MLAFVKGVDGRDLMPCTVAKARKLLRDKKAKFVKRSPFTIKLLFECENQVQDVVIGVDKGAKVTGFACIGNGKLLMSGEIHHRRDGELGDQGNGIGSLGLTIGLQVKGVEGCLLR
jgi:hypothetical protein